MWTKDSGHVGLHELLTCLSLKQKFQNLKGLNIYSEILLANLIATYV